MNLSSQESNYNKFKVIFRLPPPESGGGIVRIHQVSRVVSRFRATDSRTVRSAPTQRGWRFNMAF